MEICECGHPLESHAVHAPHYCHEDCQCDAYVQATKATHLDRFRDAVFEAAVAYAAWCKRDGPVTPEAEEQAVCTAVDDYFAAKEDS